MKLYLTLSFIFYFTALVLSVTASPSSVRDTEFSRPPAKEKTGPNSSLTEVQYGHFEKALSPRKSSSKSSTIGVNAHGPLQPFGFYGGDCSLNWNDSTSIGGGFNNGITSLDGKKTSIMGIGGGFNYNATMIDVGYGINAFNQRTNYHLSITKEGKITITFDSTKAVQCLSDPQKSNSMICSSE